MYIHHLLGDVLLRYVTDTLLLLVRVRRRHRGIIESDAGGGGVCCLRAFSRNTPPVVVGLVCVSCLSFSSVVVGGVACVRSKDDSLLPLHKLSAEGGTALPPSQLLRL